MKPQLSEQALGEAKLFGLNLSPTTFTNKIGGGDECLISRKLLY